MKKWMWLWVVLTLGATAWAGLSVSVSIRTNNSGACVTVSGMAPADCYVWKKEWSGPGNTHTLNVYVKGKDCSAKGFKAIGPYYENLSNLSPGKHTVCVNVYCVCDKCCTYGSSSRLVARSSSTFTVKACGGWNNSRSRSNSSSSSSVRIH